MENILTLSEFIKERNVIDEKISLLINRPAQIQHVGEYIAAKIFDIKLETTANHKGSDGRFINGKILQNKTVNIKWYTKNQSLLDICPDASLDYYLLLVGPKTRSMTSVGMQRPWIIEKVFLFNHQEIIQALSSRNVKIGVASSIIKKDWESGEIYPNSVNKVLEITSEQKRLLESFSNITI